MQTMSEHGRGGKNCRSGKARALSIRFVGDPVRGRRLQAIARYHGWRFCLLPEAWAPPAPNNDKQPHIVILDGFPDSRAARAAFYHLRDCQERRFLALNDAPGARRFLHVGGLSFIRMIERDPGPEAFVRAVLDLVPMNRNAAPRSRETISPAREPVQYRRINPCVLQDRACC